MRHVYNPPLPRVPAIYCIINAVNHECYVGSAINVQKRRGEHFHALHENRHINSRLQRAWNKYGSRAFMFRVLEYVDHKENLVSREQAYIDFLKPEYNLNPKAGSHLGARRDAEARDRMSKAHLGKKLSPEHAANMLAAHRGIKRSPETCANISKALKGKKQNRVKPVSETHRANLSESAKRRYVREHALKEQERLAKEQAALARWENIEPFDPINSAEYKPLTLWDTINDIS